MPNPMASEFSVEIAQTLLDQTIASLREFGEMGCEGLVLWAGRSLRDGILIQRVLVPPQNPVRSELGVGYFVSSDTLFALNRWLSENKLALLAQVHSHPAEAYHSETDDRYAIVTREGGLSLVVPNFARGPVSLSEWAVYQLERGRWNEISQAEVRKRFRVHQS